MKKYLLVLLLILIFITSIFGQEEPAFGIDFSGFVKTDILYDTRQTVSIREGHFLLYPLPVQEDNNGDDLNAVPEFNMLSIQTRLHGKITGPDALGAKTSGAIEGEFFGHSEGDINGFRLRHAFVKLNWDNTQLLVGQTWHPLFVTESFPGVISFNTGAPFQAFSRNPQVSLTHIINGLSIRATAFTQRDFASNGPQGVTSKYLRTTGMPAFNLRLEYAAKNSSGTSLLVGLSGNYLTLRPLIQYPAMIGFIKSNQKITGITGLAFARIKTAAITIKAAGLYGENTFDLTMIGGYYTEKIDEDGKPHFLPSRTLSAWTDIHTNGRVWQAGLFAGYSGNLGTASEVNTGLAYMRGANIDYLYRISPRLIYNAGKLRIAPEIEYTVAAYGDLQDDGTVTNAEEIGNLRFLIGIFYFF